MPKRSNKPATALSLRQLSSGGWVLVHPRSVLEMAEDIEEVKAMVAAGELEVAIDELRWLLGNCHDFMAAHVLLGELAIELHNDVDLARGHFGIAYQLGQKAIQRKKIKGRLPGKQPGNEPFYQAARGLAFCLEKKDMPRMADEVAALVRKLDPTDPTGVGELIDELRSGGTPIVDLSLG